MEGARIRIHFTDEDLAKTRVSTGWGRFTETVFSVYWLLRRLPPTVPPGASVTKIDHWTRQARAVLTPDMRPLLELAATRPHPLPAFLFRADHGQDLNEVLDRIRATPRTVLRQDIARLQPYARLPGWAGDLVEGDPRTLDRLTQAVRLYDEQTIGPHWADIRASLEADRAIRAQIMAVNGVGGLLASVSPRLRWDPPVLHWYAHDVRPDVPRDIFLDGRGLVLSPSLFVKDQGALRFDDPSMPVDFAYPLLQGPASDRAWCPKKRADGNTALAALVGPTRAAVLAALTTGYTTTQLARHLGISPASASEHTTVLRSAGLVASARHRNTVHHTLTPLGQALLTGNTG
jgi:hypothetical protein